MDIERNSLDSFIAQNFPQKFPMATKVAGKDVRPIYHYTSVDVFEKMLRDGADFYLSESSLLNDSAEFQTGLGILYEYKGKVGTDVFDGLTREHVEDWIHNPAEEPWIMCFSVESDSLGQWISYTDREKGGVAIGFDISSLNRKIKTAYTKWVCEDKTFGCPMYLVPCFYTKNDNQAILSLLDFMFGEYRHTVLTHCPYGDDMSRRSITMEIMLIFCSMIKHESFHAEKEWRVVFIPHSEKRIRQYSFLGGKPRLRSRMFEDGAELRDDIVDVVVSPHGSGTKAVGRLMRLWEMHIEPPRLSKSPYNGLH